MRELLERRASLVSDLRALTANGDLSDEQRGRFDTLKAEADTLQAKIDRQAVVDDFERRMQGQPVAGSGDQGFDRQLAEVGILDVIRAGMGASDRRAGLARENSEEMQRRSGRAAQGILWHMGAGAANMERRVVTTTAPSGAVGGNLVPTDFRPDLFVERLRNALVVRSLGARVLSGLTGNVDIPRLKTSATTGWVAENSALSAVDIGADKVSLTPKHAGAIVELSRNMIQQASPDVEALVRDDFAKVMAETLDKAAIFGSGSSNQPRGALNVSGIGSVTGYGSGLTPFLPLDLIGLVDAANASTGSLGFVSNTKVKKAAMKLQDGDGRFLGLDTVFHGHTARFSNSVPSNLGGSSNASAVLFGNWSDLLIGFWSELDILVNPYESTAYSKGNVSIRAMMTCDIQVRHPESFAACTDLVV